MPPVASPAMSPLRLLCLALPVLAFGLGSGCRKEVRSLPRELSLYFTCDVDGRLVPCGCFTGQYGGLTRLKTALDREAPPDAILVDVGDAIAGNEDFHFLEYQYLLKAFAALKYEAVNVGQREARLPAKRLRELRKTSPVPILSANLLDKASRRPLFEPFRLVRRGDVTIALIGLVDPNGLGDDLDPALEVAGMESTLARVLPEARRQSDFIILLAFTDEASLARLAREFYELNLILGGKVSQPSQELKKENRSYIYFTTNESRALGFLRLLLVRGEPVKIVQHAIRLLHDQIPQDQAFQELARAYREEIRHTRLAVDDPATLQADMIPGVRTLATYTGSRACLECHPSAARVWEHSGHARAFAALQELKADADPVCIECHTVGFTSLSGYRREYGASKLVNVGCESCHGPGSLHVRQEEGDKTVSFKYRPLAAGDCQKCHYGEFSRPFLWSKFWPPIKHGKEQP
jgi:Cytochrome c554 and c-prime